MNFDSTRVKIDLDVIARNFDAVKKKVGVSVMAIVKADAYGHGAVQIARLLDDQSPLLIAPTVNYGATDDLSGFPGTVSIGTEGLIHLLTAICDQLYRYGFRHFLILNGHGGNTAAISGTLPWTLFTFRFRTAKTVLPGRNTRLSFILRKATGKVWIDHVRLIESAPALETGK